VVSADCDGVNALDVLLEETWEATIVEEEEEAVATLATDKTGLVAA